MRRADVVTERHPRLGRDHRRRHRVAAVELLHQRGQQPRPVVGQGTRRQPVGQHNADIGT